LSLLAAPDKLPCNTSARARAVCSSSSSSTFEQFHTTQVVLHSW
jgi:hypothetical protein